MSNTTQYEEVWKSNNGNYYLRERDINTLECSIRKIDPIYEVYEQINTESDLKYILDQNINLRRVSFDTEKERNEYIRTCETIGKSVYGTQSPHYAFIRENYFDNKLDLNQRIWFLDIEAIATSGGFPDPEKAEWPITHIQIYDNYTNKNIVFISRSLNDPEKFKRENPDVVIKEFASEYDMLSGFLSLLEHMKPTMISTWNGENFDIPYITNRIKNTNNLNYRRLSPINVVKEDSYMGNVKYLWEGITLLDMMLAYKEFTYVTQTQYGLDHIAYVELGEGSGKIDYSEYDTIKDFYFGDFDKFTSYAAKDTLILKNLEDKLKLCELVKILAYKMGINMSDTFGTVKPWGMFLTNLAMKKNLIMPKDEKHTLDKGVVGGYVAEPQRGLHSWIASIDVNSEYPLLGIVAHNMSAETYIEEYDLHPELLKLRHQYHYDENEDKFLDDVLFDSDDLKEISKICKKHNVSFGTNAFFDNSKLGIMPEIVLNIYNERKVAKGKMLTYNVLHTKLDSEIKKRSKKNINFPNKLNYLDISIKIDNGELKIDDIHKFTFGDYDNENLEKLFKLSESKKSYWNTYQMALKISINSLYGALSNKYFVLFNRDIAASITGSGRTYIRGLSNYINNRLNLYLKNNIQKNYIIYNDTDSAYVKIEDVINKIKEKFNFGEWNDLNLEEKQKFLNIILVFTQSKIDAWVDEFTEIFADKFNSKNPSVIGAKLEKIAVRALFTDKKRYAMRVIYDEGDIRIENPKIAVTGLDTIRSSTPAFCRKELKKVLDIFFDGSESDIQDFIENTKNEFIKQPIEDISRVSGVSSLDYQYDGKYYKYNESGKRIACPVNSRASIVHNNILKKNNLLERFQPITEKDKIKYLFLKMPNPTNENVIAFLDSQMLENTGIKRYIDYDEMFEKFFISPMQLMMNACNYSTEKATTIDEWF